MATCLNAIILLGTILPFSPDTWFCTHIYTVVYVNLYEDEIAL